MMKRMIISVGFMIFCLLTRSTNGANFTSDFTELSVEAYQDKLKGGFVGQMAGVTYAAPTEFKAEGFMIPESLLPEWRPGMIKGALIQDDIYVELTFLETLEEYGLEVSQEQIGKDFAQSKYPLWHANKFGRDNIRKGILPPLSGHPKYNPHADDIDFQIEADLFGLISPGIPQAAQEMGWRFGHIMNYGDGVYGGIFISAMYSEAFFTDDRIKIVQAGLNAIPAESNYAKTIQDVLECYKKDPRDWKKAWKEIEDKWAEKVHCPDRHFLYPWKKVGIGANVNGAYVVIGLLYGEADPLQTMKIATMCGRDSDCNSASAMGILGAILGFDRLPDSFKSGLAGMKGKKFAFTQYDFDSALAAMERQSQKVLLKYGGKDQNSIWLIPANEPAALPLEQWPYGTPANDVKP